MAVSNNFILFKNSAFYLNAAVLFAISYSLVLGNVMSIH